MESKSEHVVSNEPGGTKWLENKCLRESVGRIIISLTNITQNGSVERTDGIIVDVPSIVPRH